MFNFKFLLLSFFTFLCSLSHADNDELIETLRESLKSEVRLGEDFGTFRSYFSLNGLPSIVESDINQFHWKDEDAADDLAQLFIKTNFNAEWAQIKVAETLKSTEGIQRNIKGIYRLNCSACLLYLVKMKSSNHEVHNKLLAVIEEIPNLTAHHITEILKGMGSFTNLSPPLFDRLVGLAKKDSKYLNDVSILVRSKFPDRYEDLIKSVVRPQKKLSRQF